MKRSERPTHTTESDAIDVQTFTDLEESDRQALLDGNGHHHKNGHGNGNGNGHQTESANGNTITKNRPITEETEAAPLPPDAPDAPEAEDGATALQGKSKQRRGLFLTIGAIGLIAGSIFGIRWWQFQSTHVSTENAQIKGHLSPISSKIPATVQQVLVKDGDYVKAGQALLVLQDQDIQLRIQQAEADLAAAQARLRGAEETVRVTSQTTPTQVQQAQSTVSARESAVNAAQANINQALAQVETNQANVAQAETAVNQTRTDLQRYELLYREGAISAQQRDTARTAYENAVARLQAASKTVDQSQAAVRTAQAQLQAAQAEVATAQGRVAETQVSGQNVAIQEQQRQQAAAQVKQAQASLALARQQLQYTTIVAPVSGYVGQLTAQVGQRVTASQPLLSVVPLQTDEVYVDANFKETALGKLQIGEKAEVEVDAYPGQVFHATVVGISPATGSSFALIPPDNATGNFNKVVQWVPIRLVFDSNTDPQHKLRPGLSVKVTVDTAGDPQASTATSRR